MSQTCPMYLVEFATWSSEKCHLHTNCEVSSEWYSICYMRWSYNCITMLATSRIPCLLAWWWLSYRRIVFHWTSAHFRVVMYGGCPPCLRTFLRFSPGSCSHLVSDFNWHLLFTGSWWTGRSRLAEAWVWEPRIRNNTGVVSRWVQPQRHRNPERRNRTRHLCGTYNEQYSCSMCIVGADFERLLHKVKKNNAWHGIRDGSGVACSVNKKIFLAHGSIFVLNSWREQCRK